MKTTLDIAYRDLAAEARNYADPDKVLHALHRRRTRRAAMGLALTAASVVTFGVSQVLDQPSRLAQPQTPVVQTITPPVQAAPLPTHTAAGRGTMIYTSCQYRCPTYLVVEGGQQYLLGQQTAPPAGNLTLSPDGRWFGAPTSTGYAVRDLLGTTSHHIASSAPTDSGMRVSPWFWSPDSQHVVLGTHTDGEVSRYTLVTVANGKQVTPTVPVGAEPVGMLSNKLVFFEERSYQQVPLTRVRLTLGDQGRPLTLAPQQASSTVFADKQHGLSLQVRGDHIFALGYDTRGVTVVQFDATGRQLSQTPLEEADAPLEPTFDGFAVLSAPVTSGAAAELSVLSSGGDRRVLSRLPADAQVVLPGGARH